MNEKEIRDLAYAVRQAKSQFSDQPDYQAAGPLSDALEERGYPKSAAAIRRIYLSGRHFTTSHDFLSLFFDGFDFEFIESRADVYGKE